MLARAEIVLIILILDQVLLIPCFGINFCNVVLIHIVGISNLLISIRQRAAK